MALTTEQQTEIQLEVDKQVFRLDAEAAAGVYSKEQARDTDRMNHEIAMEQRRVRLEMVRLAKETILENDRNKPTGERGIQASDITAFADTLIDYVNN